jgi:hypothetical protein
MQFCVNSFEWQKDTVSKPHILVFIGVCPPPTRFSPLRLVFFGKIITGTASARAEVSPQKDTFGTFLFRKFVEKWDHQKNGGTHDNVWDTLSFSREMRLTVVIILLGALLHSTTAYCNCGTDVLGGCNNGMVGDKNISCAYCVSTPPGYYTLNDGGNYCMNVTAGNQVASLVLQCQPGTYSTGGASNCTVCPVGKFTSAVTQSTCSKCSVGQYNPSTNQTSCIVCPTGKYTDLQGQSICTSCTAGYSASTLGSTVCSICSVGLYSSSASSACISCVAGKYSNLQGQSTCTACTSGFAATTTGSSVCSMCTGGFYSSSSSSSVCLSCGLGSYSDIGSTVCSACAAGKYSSLTSQSTCTNCTGGYSSNSGSSRCSTCSSGSYSSAGGLCIQCVAGSYSAVASSACLPCTAGTYSSIVGSSICTLCNVGKYIEQTNQSSCSNCTSGFSSISGSTVCSKCSPGLFSVTGGVCTECIGGFFSSSGTSCCLSCVAGTYSNDGSSSCITCPAGMYNLDTNQSDCSTCIAGYASNGGNNPCYQCSNGLYSLNGSSTCSTCLSGFHSSKGSSSCAKCSSGRYNIQDGASTCIDCVPGTVSMGGNMSCSVCVGGKYNSDFHQSSCKECEEGKYSIGNAVSCSVCPFGTFSLQASSICTLCTPGKYSVTSSSSCSECTKGTFGPLQGSSSCESCIGSTTRIAGAISESDCSICISGYYGSPPVSKCTPCPNVPGLNCDSGGELPFVQTGYFRTTNISAYACVPSSACAYTGNMSVTTCGTGYTGFICSQCIPGYHSSSGKCVHCPANWTKVLTILGVIIVFLLVGYRLSFMRASIPSDARILIQSLQLLAVFPRISSKWPTPMLTLFSVLSLTVRFLLCYFVLTKNQNFNIDVFSPECSLNINFWGKLRFKLWLPLVLTFASVGLNVTIAYVRYSKGLSHKFRRKDILLRLILMFDKVTMLLFTMILSSIASVFDCVRVSDERYVLRAYASSTCYAKEWYSQVLEISFFIFVYLLVFPLRLFRIFFKMKDNPKLRLDPEFNYLTSGYKPSFFWWDAVQLLKRTIFVLFSQFLFSEVDSSLRMICSIVVIICFAALEFTRMPFQFNATSKNNQTLLLILVLLCQGLIFDNDDSNAVQGFVGVIMILIFIIIAHSTWVMVQMSFRRWKRPFVVVNQMALEYFSEETKRAMYELYSKEMSDERKELAFDLMHLQTSHKGFLLKEILQCRRLCDVMYGHKIEAADNSKDVVAQALILKDETTLQMSIRPSTHQYV